MSLNENSFLLTKPSTEMLESKIFQKVNKAQAFSAEQSSLDLKCEENLNSEAKLTDEMHRRIILSYYDIKVEEACKRWSKSLFFVKTDFRSLQKIFKIAAKHGHPKGQYCLALCYLAGAGCKKSLEKAAKWHTMAILNGCETSEFFLKYTIREKSGHACMLF